MTPRILATPRRVPLARLGLFTAAEAGLLASAGFALQALSSAIVAGSSVLAPAAFLLLSAVATFLMFWLRSVLAEDVSMSYANDLRGMLMQHAVASHTSRRRLGLLAVRLTGDVTPMRDWVAIGLTDAGSGFAYTLAGLLAVWLAAGPFGAGAGAVVVFAAFVAFAVLGPGLRRAMQRLRTERGRVSALAGDIVMSAATIARYDAVEREQQRFGKRAEALRDAAVERRRIAALLEAPGGLAIAVVAVIAAVMATPAQTDWALLFFAAGLLATGLRGAGRALDSYIAFSVARLRMDTLADQIAEAAPARGDKQRLNDAGHFRTRLNDQDIDVEPGEVVLVRGLTASDAMTVLVHNAGAASESRLRGRLLSGYDVGALGRRVALSAPSAPLVRGSIRRNLSLGRRDLKDEELQLALSRARLDPLVWPLDHRIDPPLDDPDAWTQTLLRIARAIAHRPEVIVVAEPLLYHAPETPALLQEIADALGVAVLAACAVEPTPSQRVLVDIAGLSPGRRASLH